MKVALFFNKDRPDTTGGYLEKALRRRAGLEIVHFHTREALACRGGFDLYVRIDHGDYADDVPAQFRPAVFYAIDTHLKHPYRKIRAQAVHYDLIFCAQWEGARRLARESGRPTHWLPVACDPELQAADVTERQYDIGFVGTDGKKSLRKTLLRELGQRYPASFLGKAPHTELGKIYGASRIGFNYSIRNDINIRMFEVMCAGSCLVTNRLRRNGLETLFQDRRHLILYRSPRECFRLMEYLLRHDEEREAIAAAGAALVRSRHTYQHRVEEMLEVIGRVLGCHVSPTQVAMP